MRPPGQRPYGPSRRISGEPNREPDRYVGAVSLGFGPDGRRLRRKVSGKTRQEVRDKLKALHAELEAGRKPSAGYTVNTAADDWLESGLSGRSARTVQLYRDGIKPLTDRIGNRPLRKLSAADVRSAPPALSEQLSTRSLQIAHNCLVRAIRPAEADDLVGRNVAALVRPPAGQEGRPSKALTVDQARALIDAAAGRLHGKGEAGGTDDRDQARGGTGTVLGPTRSRRRDGRDLAVRPGRGRHQDEPVAADAGAAGDRPERAART